MSDDPYSPYYPGDAAVDWVGMSLYHWGNAYPWGENEIPEAGKFIAQLTGTYDGLNGDDSPLPDFYEIILRGTASPWRSRKQRPFTIRNYQAPASSRSSRPGGGKCWTRKCCPLIPGSR